MGSNGLPRRSFFRLAGRSAAVTAAASIPFASGVENVEEDLPVFDSSTVYFSNGAIRQVNPQDEYDMAKWFNRELVGVTKIAVRMRDGSTGTMEVKK
jgi:hypothetical protein